MRQFRVFILLLLSSAGYQAFGCGFYPYGESLRFCFLNPSHFNYRSFSEFCYSSDSFYPSQQGVYEEGEKQPNELLWMDYCKGKVPYKAISEAVYSLSVKDINAKSGNAMIRYLYTVKDNEALSYLRFAKKCEEINMLYDDPWERGDYAALPKRGKAIREALDLSKSAKSEALRLRYAFLAIRLSYYNRDMDKVKKIYQANFENRQDKNIVYYWSMYFMTIAEKDSALSNFYAAQVFANAPEKRFMVYQQYNDSVPVIQTLKHAATRKEKANVYLLSATLNSGRALDDLVKLHELDPKSKALGFLLLREVNKIEDWVCTPYYTTFLPSMRYDDELSVKLILNGVEKDRAYAKRVLQWVEATPAQHKESQVLWKTVQAHLLFLTRNYSESLTVISGLEKKVSTNDSIFAQLQKIKALDLTADQPNGNAVLLPAVKPIILANRNDKKFLFALGRELEFKGNINESLLLYANVSSRYDYNVYWKSRKNVKGSYHDYYGDYFEYADNNLSTAQTASFLNDVKRFTDDSDPFRIWELGVLRTELSRLYDLLGTQYIREDKLSKALECFNKMDAGYYENRYGVWRGEGYNTSVFDKNPFTDMKFTTPFMPQDFDFILTKKSITQKLIYCLNRAKNPNEKNRDYYYFLAANCYYNMTIAGNSWMMRRFGISEYDVSPFPSDEQEFREGNLAHHYYYMAYRHAKTEKFRALCLRLAKRYKLLKNKYPDAYDDLTNGCTAFRDYFKARREGA